MTVRLQPMTQADYLQWRGEAERHYAQEFVDSGILTEADAAERAAGDFGTLLPEGLDSADHYLSTAFDGDQAVGMIWVWVGSKYGADSFIYDIMVDAEQRRRGYGRAILVACEDELRRRGIGSISLNVFGANTAALHLYETFGFEVVDRQTEDGRVLATQMRHAF
ncbi:MAG: GNAT family N-acetyltransferase [Nocardioidaceae bacterium]